MFFSVIYDVDFNSRLSVKEFAPPHVRKLWQMTEGDDQREEIYEYRCNCEAEYACECGWRKVKHRKWVAVLTAKQFREFVDHVGLYAEDVQTMGSLGAPGCGLGIVDAISFKDDREDAYLSAYVTPVLDKLAERLVAKLPEQEREHAMPLTENHWKRIRKAVLAAYAA